MTKASTNVKVYSAKLIPIQDQKMAKKKRVSSPTHKKNTHTKKKHSPITQLLTKFRTNKKHSPYIKKNGISTEDLLDGVIINYPRAVKLFSFISKHKEAVGWDNSRRIVLFGQTIQKTDLIDIINAILTPGTNIDKIEGTNLFLEALKFLKAPSALVVNPIAKKLLKN